MFAIDNLVHDTQRGDKLFFHCKPLPLFGLGLGSLGRRFWAYCAGAEQK